jgi:RimJ/RimL family protein N-acetyltransferase
MIEAVETERLTLRPITMDDVEVLVELNADPDVMRFINGGLPVAREEIVEAVHEHLGHRWLAFEQSTDAVVGWFALVPTGNDERELGYRMHRSMWGKGYATEGSKALIDLAFTELGAPRVWAQTMTVNTRSRAVMERCGMRFVRTFVGDWQPKFAGSEHGDVEYEITKAEWER